MVSQTTDNLSHAPADPATAVEWTISPARRQPVLAVVGLLVILLLGVLVRFMAGDWIWGAFATVFLLATLSRFYLSSRISISPQGVRAEFPLRTRTAAWAEIERIRHDDRGALLRLNTRSLFRSSEFTILFEDHAEEAVGALERFAPPGIFSSAGRSSGS